MIKLERILVPTDFSESSEQARTYACELARRFHAEIHLLHVAAPIMPPGYMGAVPQEWLHPEENARRELEEWNDPDFEHAKGVVRSAIAGTPFIEIVRYARDREIDLIVMGTHGHSAVAQALIGSVAERVVRKAPCPVLTVRLHGHQFVTP